MPINARKTCNVTAVPVFYCCCVFLPSVSRAWFDTQEVLEREVSEAKFRDRLLEVTASSAKTGTFESEIASTRESIMIEIETLF